MNVPRISAEPGQTPSRPSGETGSGRGKTTTTACERCRRRKIRCDGETPCATCRRFRISCVRIQKNDTHALEQRVRQLEAQIAEFTAGVSSAPNEDANPLSAQQWPPDIRIATDFGSPGPAITTDEFGQFPPASLSQLDIPSIQVVDYADAFSPVSPVSPVSLSPSPLFHPLAPAPSLENLDSLRPPNTAAVSPPVGACPSPNHTVMPYLSPRSLPGPSRSRSSSISSLGLDSDWASAPGDLPAFNFESDFHQAVFDMSPTSPTAEAPRTPGRFEAEMLLDKFFDRVHRSKQPLAPYPLNRSKLFEFLDIVDSPQLALHGPCSVSMARFHVYMAMAVGLRVEADGRSTTMQMLQSCYRLAMDETRSPSFWKQRFSLEAAILVMLFSQVQLDRENSPNNTIEVGFSIDECLRECCRQLKSSGVPRSERFTEPLSKA
ncbi:Zn(II)2Cys6 transcription factor domain-containing protein [Aspergillus mulundensis]|uniref:Putative Zn(II)2Cys6 transcription factor n=1 Tax=Aspergillus mulundensis TaxID=1810919 RepID=A0A3D8Q9S5_9EURO|nr:putative Zn(II)2Cys6 transcription factor [Aspergillus mulundensis]RDW58549.1 putative Zn(II)2Cys6 transcription factor [Aspergillus mulundensis]